MVGVASQLMSPRLLAFQAGIQRRSTLSPESQRTLTKLFPWSPLHYIWEEIREFLIVPPSRGEFTIHQCFSFFPKLISTNPLLQSLKARVFYALNVGVGEKFEFHNKFLDLPLKMCFFFWHQIGMSCLLYHGASGKTFSLTSFYVYFASFIAQLVKNPPAMQETPVWFLGQEDLLENGLGYPLQYSWVSLVAKLIKNSQSLCWRKEEEPFHVGFLQGFQGGTGLDRIPITQARLFVVALGTFSICFHLWVFILFCELACHIRPESASTSHLQ